MQKVRVQVRPALPGSQPVEQTESRPFETRRGDVAERLSARDFEPAQLRKHVESWLGESVSLDRGMWYWMMLFIFSYSLINYIFITSTKNTYLYNQTELHSTPPTFPTPPLSFFHPDLQESRTKNQESRKEEIENQPIKARKPNQPKKPRTY